MILCYTLVRSSISGQSSHLRRGANNELRLELNPPAEQILLNRLEAALQEPGKDPVGFTNLSQLCPSSSSAAWPQVPPAWPTSPCRERNSKVLLLPVFQAVRQSFLSVQAEADIGALSVSHLHRAQLVLYTNRIWFIRLNYFILCFTLFYSLILHGL